MCEAVHYAAESVEKLLGCVTIQMKAILSNTSLFKVVLTFVYNTVNCEHSNESYWAVLSCGTAVADTGKVPAPPPPPFLILDQTDAQRAEKKFKTALPLPQPPPLISVSGWPGPLLIWSATALFIIPYEWVLTGMTGRSARVWPSWLQLPSAFIFFFVLFIILWERVLTFEFVHVDEIWKCNHSEKSNCRLALSVIVRYKMILTFDWLE